MIFGCLIVESLSAGTVMEPPEPLRIRRVRRVAVDEANGEPQAGIWTLVDFEAEDIADGYLADTFAQCLIADGGWYADYTVGERSRVVVFAEKVFRYDRGDVAGRAEAVAWGRVHGVPEQQLDWAD